MNRQNFLRVTLFVSVLALNPAAAEVNLRTGCDITATQDQNQNLIKSGIADLLEAKGLEREAAERISQDFVSSNGVHLAAMVQNITENTRLTKEEILSYLGNEALFGKDIRLDRYDALIQMHTKITQAVPDAMTRTRLRGVATLNQTLV